MCSLTQLSYTHTHTYTLNNPCQINLSTRLREHFISLDYNLPRDRAYANVRGQVFLYIRLTLRTILHQEKSGNTSGFSLGKSSENASHKEIFSISIVTLLTKVRGNKLSFRRSQDILYAITLRTYYTSQTYILPQNLFISASNSISTSNLHFNYRKCINRKERETWFKKPI